jgi:hypothetical protein
VFRFILSPKSKLNNPMQAIIIISVLASCYILFRTLKHYDYALKYKSEIRRLKLYQHVTIILNVFLIAHIYYFFCLLISPYSICKYYSIYKGRNLFYPKHLMIFVNFYFTNYTLVSPFEKYLAFIENYFYKTLQSKN